LARLHRAEVAALAGGDAALQEEIRRLRATLTEMEARAGLDAVPAGAHLDSWAGGGSAHGLTTRPTQDFVKRTQLRLGPHDALVTFHLGQFDSYRWIVTRNTFAFDRLPPGPALAAEVEGFANSIKSNAPAAVQEGERLYSELFGGRGKMLENKSNWLLALDDALFRLPLAALPVGRHGNRPLYLVERHATRVIPTVLFLEQAGRPAQPQNGLFLGVGDPVYNRADPRWPETGAAPWASWFAKASNDPLQMPRLIGSGREVEACARIWSRPPSSAVLLEGMDVSYARLEQELKKNPAAVHFAVHVLQPRQAQERGYDQTKPMAHPGEGYLALSLSPSGEPDFLSPAQISAWRARLGLVVLSGCSSASGDVLPATGLMGLTRAWLAAGAEAVAASQWATPDTGGEFFQTFYSRLRSASPAAALQQAQQSMITSGAWCSAPSYWAAYFVIGKD